MRDYAETHDKLDQSTIIRFAEWTISPHSNAIQGMLNQLHTIVVGSSDLGYLGKRSLFTELASYLQVGHSIIQISESVSQLVRLSPPILFPPIFSSGVHLHLISISDGRISATEVMPRQAGSAKSGESSANYGSQELRKRNSTAKQSVLVSHHTNNESYLITRHNCRAYVVDGCCATTADDIRTRLCCCSASQSVIHNLPSHINDHPNTKPDPL